MLRKLFADAFALVLASSPIHATLLSLGTACDAVGAWKVGGAKIKEDREVSGLVTGSEAKVGIVELVTALSTNPPFIWTLGHDEEARAVLA